MDEPRAGAATRVSSAKLLLAEFPDSPDAERARKLIADLEEQIRKENLGKQWTYRTSLDSMSGKNFHAGSVRSNNSFEFDFPYTGLQNARLQIRRHPRWGNDVIFEIERGQILCSTYGDCRIRVRFDDGQTRTYKGNEPSDNSSESVFIPGYKDFVQRLAKASVVRIEVDIFQEGPLVAEFDVEGFDAGRLSEPASIVATPREAIAPRPNAKVGTTSQTRVRQAVPDDSGEKNVVVKVDPSVDISSKNQNPPRYPPSAARAEITGTVLLVVDVDANGNATNVSVERSSRNRDLDRAAIDAARMWRYNAGQVDGTPTAGRVRVPVEFKM